MLNFIIEYNLYLTIVLCYGLIFYSFYYKKVLASRKFLCKDNRSLVEAYLNYKRKDNKE